MYTVRFYSQASTLKLLSHKITPYTLKESIYSSKFGMFLVYKKYPQKVVVHIVYQTWLLVSSLFWSMSPKT